jgi:hypothetical protein
MKKKKLEIDYSYDFELLGLASVAKGYKLAWEINHLLAFHLKKSEDLVVDAGNGSSASFLHYVQETSHNVLRLFKNKSAESDQTKCFLVPEHPHFDYILMIQGDEHDSKRLQKEFKAIPSIELVAFIPLDSLKSKDNFIF